MMRLPTYLLSTLPALFIATAGVSNAAVTAPVGFVEITLGANSDTPFSIPMNRPKVNSGTFSAISANTITVSSDALTAGAYVYANGTQNEKFYVLITSGPLEGRSLDITANTATSITVAQEGTDDLATILNGGVATGSFEIRPNWTLGTLFPNGEGFPKSTNFSSPTGRLLARENTTSGLNVATTLQYIYFDSTDNTIDGWYNPNNPGAGKLDDVVLRTDKFFICRNTSNTEFEVHAIGDVPLVKRTQNLNTQVTQMDNYFSISLPTDVSLSESMLVESGAFLPTQNFGLRDGDILQVYSYPTSTFNPSITGEYLYFDSADDSVDGWYIPNNPGAGKQDGTDVFVPGRAYIIRSNARSSQAVETWSIPTNYNPFTE